MSLRRRVSCLSMLLATLLLSAVFAPSSAAQQPTGAWKALTVERIYAQPSLSGRLTRGLAWTPDGKQLNYFETKGAGKDAKTELWVMDAASGERRLLVAADKLESILPVDTSRPTQATGLGRRAPSQYQWAPDGTGILFQGPTALAWLDLKSQTGRTLVSGKATLADPKISPDGRFVSFIREHNLWLVSVADGKERAVTRGGTEEIRKGELDWVYPEELEIKTAYWWSPDSSAIAYLEMDERRVSQYPLVDFSSPRGEAELERYPVAGGANPVVRVLVVFVQGGEPRAMDIGAETDIYIPRVNWLNDSKHIAIQHLNREQNTLDLLIADAATDKTRTALSEQDPNWVNVSDDLYFFKDGKRFLWSSERTGYRHLYLYDLDGKLLAQLTKGEGTHDGVLAPNAATFYDTHSNTAAPPRQDLYRTDGSRIAVINENQVAELADYHLSPVEFLTVKSRDGVLLNASIIKPPNFDAQKKYPVLVSTYGGPHAQVVRNAWGGSSFLWHELMAQKGYIIFLLDNRGSAGRGHVFETPLHLRLGA